ncbi:MAG: biotin--[acetyl-CoA-carboxylase] ligase [Candidatus Pelagibacter sp.]
MKLKKFIFNKIKSTNDTAIRLIKNGEESGIISANIQTKGKGQRGNKWISKRGNLFLTIFFIINNKISLKKITSINLFILKKIITNQIKVKTQIKLPNDILIYKKKVCGILQEIIFKNNLKYLIVGVGINIISSPDIKKYPTTYLNKYSKNKINKIKLINEIKLVFENQYKDKIL